MSTENFLNFSVDIFLYLDTLELSSVGNHKQSEVFMTTKTTMIKKCSDGHQFKHDNNLEHCPKCGNPLNFVFIEEERVSYEEKVKQLAKDRQIKNLNDSLPRVPWFNEIKNNKEMGRSSEKWSLEEAELLKEFYHDYGFADVETWKKIAEGFFERSLYSIEHILRFVIAEVDLEQLYS